MTRLPIMLDQSRPITLPTDLHCPICGEECSLRVVEVEKDRYGWRATRSGLEITCTTEPDIEDPYWDDWHDGHYSMPYVDWFPFQARVLEWLTREVRFIEQARNSASAPKKVAPAARRQSTQAEAKKMRR